MNIPISETCNHQAVKRIRKECEKVIIFNTNSAN
jgi:hypothetical protein